MSRRKQLLWIYLLVVPVVLVMALLGALLTESAVANASECRTCHSQEIVLSEGKLVNNQCKDCDSANTSGEASVDGFLPLEGWSVTGDLPNWNALIDERPLVIEIHH